jgi:hypothetical protein
MAKKPRELRDAISRVQSYPKGDPLSSTLPPLEAYIPDFSAMIAKDLSRLFVSILNASDTDKVSLVFDFMLLMFDSAIPSRQETLPFSAFLSSKDCLPGLLKHAKANDDRAYRLIGRLFEFDTKEVSKWLRNHARDLRPICESIPITQSVESARFLLRISVADPQLLSSLLQYIRPLFPKYPLSIALEFMVHRNEMREFIPAQIVPFWLLEHPTCFLNDVKLACDLYPVIWGDEAVSAMFVRTAPPDDFKDVEWIHGRLPTDFKVSVPVTAELCTNILRNCGAELFLFVRFFILSFADHSIVNPRVFKVLKDCLANEYDYLVVAAMQVIATWSVKQGFQTPPSAIYAIALRAVRNSGIVGIVARIALRCIAERSQIAAALICNDQKLKVDNVSSLESAPSIYPHFMKMFGNVKAKEISDPSQSVRLLSCVVEYLASA